MALAGRTGSGCSGTLSTNPTIRQQQLICDPNEPLAGSTSVSYNPTLVTLAAAEAGPGYNNDAFQVLVGVVERTPIEGDPVEHLVSLSAFLNANSDENSTNDLSETGYAQVKFTLTGDPGQIFAPEGYVFDEHAGPDSVDTHALYFNAAPTPPPGGTGGTGGTTDGPGGNLASTRDFAVIVLPPGVRVLPNISYTVFAAAPGTRGGNEADFLVTPDGERIEWFDIAPATVTSNPGPTITHLSTNAGSVGSVSEGQPVSLTGLFSNPSLTDIHAAQINWGDGSTPTTILPATSPVTASHSYAAGGVYDVTLLVMDDDGQSDTETTRVYITGAGVSGGVLEIVGTGGDDRIEVSTKDTNGDGVDDKVRVSANFIPGYHRLFDIGTIQVVHVMSGGGNDKVSVWETLAADSVLEGGDGNDTLYAGRRSLLVGGAGADSLNGADGNDTLIPGISPHAGDLPELLAILNGLETTMINDFAVDTVAGNRGTDTFYLNANDILRDPYIGRDGVERFFFV